MPPLKRGVETWQGESVRLKNSIKLCQNYHRDSPFNHIISSNVMYVFFHEKKTYITIELIIISSERFNFQIVYYLRLNNVNNIKCHFSQFRF